jgi:hypothetical protein
MSTDFNAAQFLDDVQGDAIESKFTPVPTGDYPAGLQAETITVEPVQFKDGNTGASGRISCSTSRDSTATAARSLRPARTRTSSSGS